MISPSFNSSFIHLNMCSCVMFMWLWILKLSSFSSGILIVSLIVFFSVLFCVTCARFNASFGFFLCFSWFFVWFRNFFNFFFNVLFLLVFTLKYELGKLHVYIIIRSLISDTVLSLTKHWCTIHHRSKDACSGWEAWLCLLEKWRYTKVSVTYDNPQRSFIICCRSLCLIIFNLPFVFILVTRKMCFRICILLLRKTKKR